jgi:hypothetical protein
LTNLYCGLKCREDKSGKQEKEKEGVTNVDEVEEML